MCVHLLLFDCVFRKNSVTADSAEILVSNNSFSHVAMETVVMTTEQSSHLSVASRPADSLPTPVRGLSFVSCVFFMIHVYFSCSREFYVIHLIFVDVTHFYSLLTGKCVMQFSTLSL